MCGYLSGKSGVQEPQEPGCATVDADGVSKTCAGALSTALTDLYGPRAPGPAVQDEGVDLPSRSPSFWVRCKLAVSRLQTRKDISLTHGGPYLGPRVRAQSHLQMSKSWR